MTNKRKKAPQTGRRIRQPCGCWVLLDGRFATVLSCPLHEAAYTLLQAVRHLSKRFGHHFINHDDDLVNQAIAKAEGRA